MSGPPIAQLLRGPFHFLEPVEEEFERRLPEWSRLLPLPYPIYLHDETSTLLHGFPVLVTDGLVELREALNAFLEAEEGIQLAVIRREPLLRTAHNASWRRYRDQLVRAIENSLLSSYGRNYSTLFWLHHSLDVSRQLRDTPRRITRLDLRLGQKQGDEIRYRVFDRYQDRIRTEILPWMSKLSPGFDDASTEGAVRLLRRMLDNVLIFTEEQISPDLLELNSFFAGFIRRDGRLFRQKLARVASWHEQLLASDATAKATGALLLGVQTGGPLPAERLLYRPGYLELLSTRPGYDTELMLGPEEIAAWEDLLGRLKDFELLQAFRNLLLPVRWENGELTFRAGGLDRTWIGQRNLKLAPSTRPLNFFSPTVIEPLVHRHGMIYDISEFSEVISVLSRAGSELQERAFRQMYLFQREVNQLAQAHRLQLEKYLGDGAFYTNRLPLPILLCAVDLQRCYREAIARGLPFNRGMRIGLNFGHYRLIPIQGGSGTEPDRYEFFGHGVVELTRLTSGKSSLEIHEIKNTLISYGYPPQAVLRFFEPLEGRNLDLVDREEENRPFYAYINRNGSLINEGIVATQSFVANLSRSLGPMAFSRGQRHRKPYLFLHLEDSATTTYLVGVRRLGLARLKGLDEVPLYEFVDGAAFGEGTLEPFDTLTLLEALERLGTPFSSARAASPAQPAASKQSSS